MQFNQGQQEQQCKARLVPNNLSTKLFLTKAQTPRGMQDGNARGIFWLHRCPVPSWESHLRAAFSVQERHRQATGP